MNAQSNGLCGTAPATKKKTNSISAKTRTLGNAAVTVHSCYLHAYGLSHNFRNLFVAMQRDINTVRFNFSPNNHLKAVRRHRQNREIANSECWALQSSIYL